MRLHSLLTVVPLALALAASASPDGRPGTPPAQARQEAAPSTGPGDGVALTLPAGPAESWEGIARRLGAALTNGSARDNDGPVFAPGARAWAFGEGDPESPAAVRGRFVGMQIVLLETYVLRTATPASDLGRALRAEDSPVTPDFAHLVRPRAGEERAADGIASQWLRRAVSAGADDRVAVVVLWDPSDAEQAAAGRLWFVLARGSQLADGRWRVETLRYGTAADAIRHGA